MTVCECVWATHPRRPLHSVGQAGVDDVLLRRTLQRSSSVNYSSTTLQHLHDSSLTGCWPANTRHYSKATTDQHLLNSHDLYFWVCASLRLLICDITGYSQRLWPGSQRWGRREWVRPAYQTSSRDSPAPTLERTEEENRKSAAASVDQRMEIGKKLRTDNILSRISSVLEAVPL